MLTRLKRWLDSPWQDVFWVIVLAPVSITHFVRGQVLLGLLFSAMLALNAGRLAVRLKRGGSRVLFGRRRTMTLPGRGDEIRPSDLQRAGTVDVSPVNEILDKAREKTERAP